ncbi:MAG: hypothetical protein M3Z85_21430 [Acidobacteriota bacterium]|nr:hypothetical protein [Acidobacteriota bacterium]
MPEEALFERANGAMQAATVFLLDPNARNLDRARGLLQEAAGALVELKLYNSSLSDRMPALRQKVRIIDRLLQCAGVFHGGVAIAVGRLNAVYAPGGGIAPGSRTSGISVHC